MTTKTNKSRTIIESYPEMESGKRFCKVSLYTEYIETLRGRGLSDDQIAFGAIEELKRWGERKGGLRIIENGTIY